MKFTLSILAIIIHLSIKAQTAFEIKISGKGDPVIFLPGFGTPGSVWDETISTLKGNHEYHQLTYAGFNGLAPIDTPWYHQIKIDLFDYVAKNKSSNIKLVGHSMGGNLALELAKKFPQKINRIMLIETLPCIRELMMPGVPASMITYNSPYNKQMLGSSAEEWEMYIHRFSDNMTFDEAKRDQIFQWAKNADKKTYVYGYTDLLKLDQRTLLEDIEIETWILVASFPDASTAIETMKDQFKNLERKIIYQVENSRHFIMFDQPEWLSEKIIEFLSNNELGIKK